jgi:hypothetical protein
MALILLLVTFYRDRQTVVMTFSFYSIKFLFLLFSFMLVLSKILFLQRQLYIYIYISVKITLRIRYQKILQGKAFATIEMLLLHDISDNKRHMTVFFKITIPTYFSKPLKKNNIFYFKLFLFHGFPDRKFFLSYLTQKFEYMTLAKKKCLIDNKIS